MDVEELASSLTQIHEESAKHQCRDEVLYSTKSLPKTVEKDICYARLSTKSTFFFCSMLPMEIVDWYMEEVQDFFPADMWEQLVVTPLEGAEAVRVLGTSRLIERSSKFLHGMEFAPKALFSVKFSNTINKNNAFVVLNLFRMLHENQDVTLTMFRLHSLLPKLSFDVLYALSCSVHGRTGHVIGHYHISHTAADWMPFLGFSFKTRWEKASKEFLSQYSNERHPHINGFFNIHTKNLAEVYKYLDKIIRNQFLEVLIKEEM